MLSKALLCAASIFLWTGISAMAQNQADAQDIALQQALCEREAYYSGTVQQKARALIMKSQLQERGGEAEEAIRTLARVPLYVLEPDEAETVQQYRDSLSAVIYENQEKRATPDGWRIAGDACLTAFGVSQAFCGNWITAYLTGTYGLYNIWNALF